MSVVRKINDSGTNKNFILECPIASEFKIDQSLSHDGVCLTVTDINYNKNEYTVTAIQETLNRTNLAQWEIGKSVNLERCMPSNGRFDGHIVQGHVDCTGIVDKIEDRNGSFHIYISHPANAGITVEKGSVTLNGISLTIVQSSQTGFSVAIIPYTWQNTNLHELKTSDLVNIEFDIIGKYLQKMNAIKTQSH